MPREQLSRRCKRSRPMMESGNFERPESCSKVSIPVIVIGDESDETICEDINSNKTFQRRRRSKTEPVKSEIKLAPIFLPRREREQKTASFMPMLLKPVVTEMSEATKNFLYSGVPEVIAKNQKIIKKRKMESDLMETHDIFPVVTHVNAATTERSESPTTANHSFRYMRCGEVPLLETKPRIPFDIRRAELIKYSGNICCAINNHQASDKLLTFMKKSASPDDTGPMPWVVKYQLTRHGYLAMKNKTRKTFMKWLKEWRNDIREDGGSSRKILKKRKKGKDSEEDFIEDSDGDDPQKHKSVLLVGPTGSAKSTMVYVLAKRCGFKVLEVNFSSRRSGHEVLRRVEEATLSRRLATPCAVDNKHCLILFRDIDQLYLEEDEGFHGALAQLIAASLRPIVMTITSDYPNPTIDSKIEKKEPLWINVGTPPLDLIISNVLLPIIKREIWNLDEASDYDLDKEPGDLNYIQTILQSIIRHCKCDIKQSINQAQLLWSTSTFTLDGVHATLHPKFDTDFNTASVVSPNFNFPTKETTTQTEMDEIANKFKFLTDLDRVDSSSVSDPEYDGVPNSLYSYFDTNFDSILNTNQRESSIKPPYFLSLFRSLTLQTDEETAQLEKNFNLYDDIVTKHLLGEGNADFDEVSYFRTILKTSVINSVGRKRRHGRLQYHFSNVGRDVIDSICNNLDFDQRLQVVTEVGGITVDD